jgi:uncharacterized membrane protein (UPF0136 family)
MRPTQKDLRRSIGCRQFCAIKEKNMANPKMIFAGEVAQVAGVGAVVLGVVLSLKHWPAALALIGGIAAFYVGKKMRAM